MQKMCHLVPAHALCLALLLFTALHSNHPQCRMAIVNYLFQVNSHQSTSETQTLAQCPSDPCPASTSFSPPMRPAGPALHAWVYT